MDFASFILLNALLFIRPEDLFPEIAGLRLYLITIVICTVASLHGLQYVLSVDALHLRPVALCVLGMLLSTILSFIFRGMIDTGYDFSTEFAKVILYYFLLIALVNSPERLRAFLASLAMFIGATMVISLMNHHGIYEFRGLEPVMQWAYDPETGSERMISRLVSCGLFHDPNDLCVILAFGMVLCVGLAFTAHGPIPKLFWLIPVIPFFYTCTLTHSRGGLLALFAGIAAYGYGRYGLKKSIPALIVVIPAILLAASGRQASIGSSDTAHERLMMWAYGLGDLFNMPFHIVTGLAPGHYIKEYGLLAHNSFINAYVELGVLGGGFFFAAFFYAFRMIYISYRRPDAPDWAKAIGPFILAAIATYGMGCYSLSRNFHLPTYTALGLATAFASLAQPMPPPDFRVTKQWWKWFAVTAVAGLVLLKYSTQLLGRLGV